MDFKNPTLEPHSLQTATIPPYSLYPDHDLGHVIESILLTDILKLTGSTAAMRKVFAKFF
jgi:hypothetical protein